MQPVGRIDQAWKVIACSNAHPLEHVDRVLGRDIAGGGGGEGAAADAADRCIQRAGPGAPSGIGICQPRVARIVEMKSQ